MGEGVLPFLWYCSEELVPEAPFSGASECFPEVISTYLQRVFYVLGNERASHKRSSERIVCEVLTEIRAENTSNLLSIWTFWVGGQNG